MCCFALLLFPPVFVARANFFLPPLGTYGLGADYCVPRIQRPATRLLLAARGLCSAAELGQYFFLAQDQQLFVVNLDFRAAVLAEQHAVAGFHIQRNRFALLALAGADGDHFALLLLLLG